MLIVLEGLDGSGKTTLSHELIKALPELDLQYRHYPYDVDPALPKNEFQRACFWDLINHPPTADSNWVLDRYYQSSLAYGLSFQTVSVLYEELPMPDLAVYLYVPPIVSVERCNNKPSQDEFDLLTLPQKIDIDTRFQTFQWDLIIDTSQETVEQSLGKLVDAVKKVM